MLVSEFMENIESLTFVELGRATYYVKEQEIDLDGVTSSLPLGELLGYIIDGVKVSDIVSEDGYEMLVAISGGRGSSSDAGDEGGEQTFKFDHARERRGNEKLPDEKHFPSEMNDGEKFQSVDKAIDKFGKKTVDANREYAITVDENGYVHQYVTGGSVSVRISGRKGQMIVHNHPGGGAFSDGDLLSTAQGPEKGIVATTPTGHYIFTKAKGFKPTEFSRAVKNARPKGKSYDDAVDKWLTANQSKYGYKYEFRKF